MKHKHFKFSVSDPKETDLTLVSVEDERTGFTVRTALPNAGKQTASIMAFAGARFSRSAMSAYDIFKEVKDSGKNANEKLANIFHNYGHASVGDMALLFAYIEQIPDSYHFEFFYNSRVGAGQVRSTRYQDFTKSYPPKFENYINNDDDFSELKKEYDSIFKKAIRLNKKFIEKTKEAFTNLYELEEGNKQQLSALQARTFDTARVFLPAGINTSFAYITSAREWARLISVMKSDDRKMVQYLGEQLEILFAPPEEVTKAIDYTPEAPDLVRHTKADKSLYDSLREVSEMFAPTTPSSPALRENPPLLRQEGKIGNDTNRVQELEQEIEIISEQLTSAEIVLYQVLLTSLPNLSVSKFKNILKDLTEKEKKKISKVLYEQFNHHSQLGRQSELSSYAFKISATFSEMRDLGRHRAWGRFTPICETENIGEILNSGYILPLYLQNEKLKDLKKEFKQSLEEYYGDLFSFYNKLPDGVNKKVVLNLLPFAHKIDYIMHGSPKEVSYMTKLRIRPGGHINYRMLAYMLGQETAKIEPLLSGLGFKKSDKPNLASREEFFDRS